VLALWLRVMGVRRRFEFLGVLVAFSILCHGVFSSSADESNQGSIPLNSTAKVNIP
jgi:hypothetical protein